MIYEILKLYAQVRPNNSDKANALTNFPEAQASEDQLKAILMVVFGIAGAIAVLVIVLSAISIITGGDNPEQLAKARRSILYALVGLIIAISAEIIVMTVVGKIGSG